jgi:long-chain fatty acid transport protein
MKSGRNLRALILASAALITKAAAINEANAGAFAIREQSAYFTGDAYAGSAAGGDISSMFWNSAATATLPGTNSSSSYYGIIGSAPETATGGSLSHLGLPESADVGTNAFVTSSYLTYQYSDRLYLGIALDAPFGFITKPDNSPWAGSAIANTSRVFTIEANPTIAYKITPELTIGVGAQIEYFEIKLNRSALIQPGVGAVSPSAYYQADDVGAGATAGIIWQPAPGTSLGVGYRSAVSVNPSGTYSTSGFIAVPPAAPTPTFIPSILTNASASLSLPGQVTASFRQALTQQLTVLGTAEWQDWSSIGNVSSASTACLGGVCETLNLNYRDGWFFSLGAEYAYDPQWTFRTGVGYEISPITDSNRDILLPDSNRVHVNVGATYKWSDKIAINVAYSHIFFDDAPFCIASPAGTGTTHCVSGTAASSVLLSGYADPSVDIVSIGLSYKLSGPAPLEPLK